MSHNHHDHHHHGTKNISIAFFLNLAFTIIEIIGGFLTNSVAILSDAFHDLGDSMSLGVAWYFQKMSTKNRDSSYSFGYKRFSVLGALINSIVLIAGMVFILTQAIPRLIHPEETNTKGMMAFAILGIIINGSAVFFLKKGESINEKVVALHLLEDVLGWVAILIGSIVMYFYDLPIIDPILSIGIAIYISFNVVKNVKASMKIIMQGVPENVRFNQVIEKVSNFKDVEDIHDLHIWSLDGNYNILSTHITLKSNKSLEEIAELKKKIKNSLLEIKIQHATIEFENKDEVCDTGDCAGH